MFKYGHLDYLRAEVKQIRKGKQGTALGQASRESNVFIFLLLCSSCLRMLSGKLCFRATSECEDYCMIHGGF